MIDLWFTLMKNVYIAALVVSIPCLIIVVAIVTADVIENRRHCGRR